MNADLPLSSTPRTTINRLRERGRVDRGELDAVLDAGLVCHLGVVIDGAPVVLPTGYGRIGQTLYLHGSSANRSLLMADGQQVCVTVTLLDGLVCARAVFHHSMNYRSAVIFGEARLVTDGGEKLRGAAGRDRSPGARPLGRRQGADPQGDWPPRRSSRCRWTRRRSRSAAAGPKDDPEDYDSGILGGRPARRADVRAGRARSGAQPGTCRARAHQRARRAGSAARPATAPPVTDRAPIT